jgi:hypothetical protein
LKVMRKALTRFSREQRLLFLQELSLDGEQN